MNYADQLKQKESKLFDLRAQVMAKKQSIAETLEKRQKAETEVQNSLGISLAEVPSALAECKDQLSKLCEKLNEEVEEIEHEFSKIKC
jgi:flagellar biosynthesis/type III secretory pathway chaperone